MSFVFEDKSGWSDWINSKYALCDLIVCHANIQASPSAREMLKKAIVDITEELEIQREQLQASQLQRRADF